MRDHLSDARAWPLLVALVLGATLIYLLRPILAPFLVGALLAYLADPLADRLEALGMGRTLSVVVVFLALSLLFAGAVLLLLPLMGRQLQLLQSLLPQAVDWVQHTGLPWLRQEAGLEIPAVELESLRQVLAGHWQSTGNVAAAVLSRFTQSTAWGSRD
ncbi:MAG TPA: AI-2E family transporter [Pseudohaliea sp.]|nr:AI-2E family transporter [Pseudohaliea sp.]